MSSARYRTSVTNKIGWFKCPTCGTKWHALNVRKGDVRPCNKVDCNTMVEAHHASIKAFGHFRCKKCNKTWSSAHTYANTFQKCKKCNVEVLPHKMDQLEFSGIEKEGDSPHMESLCGRCIALGRRCCKDKTLDDVISNFQRISIRNQRCSTSLRSRAIFYSVYD